MHHIDNLDLLHKSKEESQFDLLQQKARSDEDALNAWADNEVSEDHIHEEYDSDNENEDGAQADANAVIEEIVSCSMTSTDWYVLEAKDANSHAGYITSQFDERLTTSVNVFHFCSISLNDMKQSVEMLKLQMTALAEEKFNETIIRESSVFIISDAEIDSAIQLMVQKFTLNQEQTRAFSIIANHSLGRSKVGSQLLMRIFGEGGTEKSRVIEAICD